MAVKYLITPLAWILAGGLKFAVNSVKAQRLAFDLAGYGGFPSNHSAIVVSIATLVGLTEGMDTAIFGLAWAFSLIVILDAPGLRYQLGRHAQRINQLHQNLRATPPDATKLYERMGHTPWEIFVGGTLGALVAFWIFHY